MATGGESDIFQPEDDPERSEKSLGVYRKVPALVPKG